MVSFALIVVATASVAAALPEHTPAPRLEKRIDCAKITGALSILKKLGEPATSFCSEYLHIPKTLTKTRTSTPYTTKFTSVATATITRSVCPKPRQNRREEFEFAEPADVKRRDNVSPLLAGFAAAKISEGCSCLSLQPKATTTRTVTARTVTRKITSTSVKCVVGPGTCIIDDGFCMLLRPFDCCSGYCRYNPLDSSARCGPPCDADDSPCPLSGESTVPFNCCSGYCAVALPYDPDNPDGTCQPSFS